MPWNPRLYTKEALSRATPSSMAFIQSMCSLVQIAATSAMIAPKRETPTDSISQVSDFNPGNDLPWVYARHFTYAAVTISPSLPLKLTTYSMSARDLLRISSLSDLPSRPIRNCFRSPVCKTALAKLNPLTMPMFELRYNPEEAIAT